jgi:hypothetical protein
MTEFQLRSLIELLEAYFFDQWDDPFLEERRREEMIQRFVQVHLKRPKKRERD